MAYLLYSRGTKETGSYLGDLLQIEHGTEPPERREDILIRWGSSVAVPHRPAVTLNRRAAIETATNKFLSLEVMHRNNISVPRFSSVQDMVRQHGEHITTDVFRNLGYRVPILARNRAHTRGQDVLLCLQDIDFARAIKWDREFFIEYIPTKSEYRVHVFRNNVIRVSEKVLRNRKNYVPYLRTHDNNHVFQDERTPLSNENKQVAVNAVRAIGLDFGAVDILVSDDNRSYVLEVNTGPSLMDSGAEIYVYRLREEIARAT